MKKIFIITGVMIFSALTAYTAEVIYSNVFINKIIHCLPAAKSYTLTDENGVNTDVKMGLHGWKNGACRYSEIRVTGDETVTYNCNFSRDQISELSSAMKNDPTGEGVAEQTFERFKKIPEVCTQPE